MAKFQVTEVQKSLKGFNYPGSAEDLAGHAKSNGAPDDLVEALRSLDKKDGFSGPNTVMKALSEQADALGGSTPGGRTERKTKDVEGPAWQVVEVQKALKGAKYPMNGKQLSDLAKSNGAEQELVEALSGLGEINGPNKVMAELKSHLGGPAGRDS